ncbi:MAG: hypothetical protein SFU99_22580 [Saprospiraceae bacterium]|nr:hypothetical protein [Saprospiraceae bacterium]
MDVVKELANEFIRRDLRSVKNGYQKPLESLRYKLFELNKEKDKIEYLEIIQNQLVTDLENHRKECKHEGNCQWSKNYEAAIYFINQELEGLGIIVSDDLFTEIEKNKYDTQIDEILKEVEKLRKGQEIIYDDLISEIRELKQLYFLNKKNWRQLLMGKITELVIGGLNQELANKIISSIIQEAPKLLK